MNTVNNIKHTSYRLLPVTGVTLQTVTIAQPGTQDLGEVHRSLLGRRAGAQTAASELTDLTDLTA